MLAGFLLGLLVAVGLVGIATAVVRFRRLVAPAPDSESGEGEPEVGAEERAAHAEAVQEWLLSALDELDDAVLVVDRLGREVARNRAARRRAEARTGELLAEPALTELLGVALTGTVTERDLRVYGPPRSVLQLRAHPIRHGDEVVGAVGFVRDVSEAHRTDTMRRDFVANVSHELTTPIGALGLLAETIATADDVEVAQRLSDRIVRETDRLSHLVDDLLDLSTIEAQEAPIREPLPVRRLVDEAVDIVQAAAVAAVVPVVVADDIPDVEILCDERQIRIALTNLLDNAIKYSEPGAAVEVTAVMAGDDRVTISVRDHGIGIPARSLERIFERFYRVDRARSRESGGTGLGLAIVRHAVQAHGGEVTVTSTEGEGSEFTLRLPAGPGYPGRLPVAS
ncbi:MAG: sensor histidine kinase [Actinomycetota bacterium]